MKPLLFAALLLSVAGNVVLAWQAYHPATATAAAINSKETASTPADKKAGQVVERHEVLPPTTWKSIQPNGDLHALVTNLRSAGFPPSVLRAVVNDMLQQQYADRNPLADGPYWKRNSPTADQMAEMRKLSDERRSTYEELLGPDAKASASMTSAARAQRYGNLSDEKIDALEKLNREYSEIRAQAYAARNDTPQDMMKQQEAMESEKRKDLAAILSPEELEQYDLRNSRSANAVMNRLRGLDVTEDEYKALYQAQKAYDDATVASRTGTFNQQTMEQRNAAQLAMNEQTRTVLGDDRFFEYLKTADQSYAQALRFTSQYPSITPANTYELTKIERAAQSAMQKMAQNRDVPMQQRMLEARSTMAQYEAQISALIGPEAMEGYKKQGMGRMFSSFGNSNRSQ